MDGARFLNALARLNVGPAEATWKAGVDVLSFGATKGGALAAEAVVFFDPQVAAMMPERRKRAGHLFSKHRFLAAQFEAYLNDDYGLTLARHANAMADLLAARLKTAGIRVLWPVEANLVFAAMPKATRCQIARGRRRLLCPAQRRPARGRSAGADGDVVRDARRRSRAVRNAHARLTAARGAALS